MPRRKKDPDGHPELFTEERLRPWAIKPQYESQYHSMVDDLEKLQALTNPIKEDYGASEIDRALGLLDHDLLLDEPALEEGQEWLREEAEYELSRLPFVLVGDKELHDFLHESQNEGEQGGAADAIQEGLEKQGGQGGCGEKGAYEGGGEVQREEVSGMGAAAAGAAAATSGLRAVADRRPAAVTARTGLEDRGAALPSIRSELPTARTGASGLFPDRSLGRLSRTLKAIKAERLKVKADHERRRAAARVAPARNVPLTARSSLHGRHLHSSRRPSSRGSARAGAQPHPPAPREPRPLTAHAVVQPFDREREQALRQRGGCQAGAPQCARPESSPANAGAGRRRGQSTQAQAPAAPLETTRPSSRQATVRDIVEVTRARSQPQASEAGPTRPLPRPATANAALRGNSAPAAPLVWDYDNYKVRSQILKEQLNRFEMSVLENANPTELNRIMRARGKMDHVWAVFRDPTIDKEEDKQLMTSATQRAFAWDEHKEYETRHAPLCPEYCITRSIDAKWAENALANGVKVFLSSKNGLKPKKSE